jgi:F0F1-type ATP synthase assembly protein I
MKLDHNQLSSYLLATGVAAQVGCLMVVTIGIALGLGLLADRVLGTKPVFFLILLLGSIPLNLWLIYRYTLHRARKIQASSMQKEDTARDD